jgi:hypothetical protein
MALQAQDFWTEESVIPAKAGIQCSQGPTSQIVWIPAFAGMTSIRPPR